jgi:transaldolase
LNAYGQSVWLDYISRALIDTGKLKELIDIGLRGLTSNPTIFDKAISTSNDYDTAITELKNAGRSTFEIYDELTIKDIQNAADAFMPVYEKTEGADGYVSLEINPTLAYQTDATISEGKRLFKKVNRPNLMLKVPATDEGFPAVKALLSEAINVNITLIFSLQQYIDTAEAYLSGIEQCIQKNGDVRKVRSVASIFVSRIDTLTDKLLEEKHALTDKQKLEAFMGTAAVANSAIIYARYREIFNANRFLNLQSKGANVQRVLWGSTSTKNPAYSDIKYVKELIGKDTVNTIPESTLRAFIDHGTVQEALTEDAGRAREIITGLFNIDIDINDICDRLLKDGVVAFEKSFVSLLNNIETKASNL